MSGLHTWLTRSLLIEHPILSAGMGRVAQVDLAAAVSSAGGLGMLGGVSYQPAALRDAMRQIRARTARPYGVNLVMSAFDGAPGVRRALDSPHLRSVEPLEVLRPMFDPVVSRGQVDVVLDERPDLLALAFATPAEVVTAAHSRGILVASLVGSVAAAQRAEAAGADLVIAQGYEAGGHTGTTATTVLLPMIADAVSLPVVAAGGIADGRGLAASLALGACGVWVGTRFACTHEAYGHVGYKQRMLEAAPADTVITRSYSGKTLRAVANTWTSTWADRPEELKAFPEQYTVSAHRAESGFVDGDRQEGMMPAGQAVGLVSSVERAGDVVQSMAAEADEVLKNGVWSR